MYEFGGRNSKGEMLQLYYNIKNKIEKESLESRMDQTQYRISGLKGKIEVIDQPNKKYEIHHQQQNTGKEHTRNR